MSGWLGLLLVSLAAGGGNLTPNSGCEQVENGYPTGWTQGWCRDGAELIKVELMSTGAHAGRHCLHLTHTGKQDWSLNPGDRMAVRPGDIFELDVRLRIAGPGVVTLCAMVLPPDGVEGTPEWVGGGRELHGPKPDWTEVRTRLVVGPDKAWMTPRLIGTGPVETYVDDFTVRALGNIDDLRAEYAGPRLVMLAGKALQVELHPADGTAGVTDLRTGRVWRWQPSAITAVPVGARPTNAGVDLRFHDVTRDDDLSIRYELVARDRP
jgi:hypothetical protein